MRVEGYGLRSETPGARTRGALNRGGVGGTQRAGPPPPRRGARARPRPRATGRTGRVGQPRGDGGSWRVAKSRGPKWRPGGRRRKAKGKERRVKRTLAANSTGGFNNGWNGRSARLPPTTGWPTYTRLGPFHPLVVRRHGHFGLVEAAQRCSASVRPRTARDRKRSKRIRGRRQSRLSLRRWMSEHK